jgi:hypothetical protein
MPATLAFLEQVRRTTPTKTDYAIAKALGIQQSHLRRIMIGEVGLGPKQIIRVSEILGKDLRDVFVLIEEDKARKPADREFWGKRSPRITATILTAVLGISVAAITTNRVETRRSLDTHPVIGFTCYTLCEVRV